MREYFDTNVRVEIGKVDQSVSERRDAVRMYRRGRSALLQLRAVESVGWMRSRRGKRFYIANVELDQAHLCELRDFLNELIPEVV